MQFNYKRLLQLMTIAVFVVELMAPLLFFDRIIPTQETDAVDKVISEYSAPLDLLSQLLFEEAGNEEKEDKDNNFISSDYVELFSNLEKFEPARISESLPRQRFNSQPPLFTLYRVLLI